MIVSPKDVAKLLGILVMTACAVLVCSLFMNSNIDLARIKDQITDMESLIIYDMTVSSGIMTIAVTGGALGLTTLVMLFFYIKHYIDTHKPELGILKALGYSNWKVAKGFWVFGLSVFLGAIIGFCLAYVFMPVFYEQMRSGGPLPDVPLHFNPELIVVFLVLPAIAFSLISVLYSYRRLKLPALELIRGKNSSVVKKSGQVRFQETGKPFLKDLKHNTVRGRFSLVFFIALSAFIYSNNTQMSFGIAEFGAGGMMAALMVGTGVVLSITALFIAVTTVIRANGKTIAMLRVFGYSNRECGDALLSGYRPAACVGFILGTAYQYGLMRIIISLVFNDEAIAKPAYSFDIWVFIISLSTFVVLYEGIMFLYTVRIKRIPLKEIMQEG